MRRLFAIGFTAVLVAGVAGIVLLTLVSGGPSEEERRAELAAEGVAALLTKSYGLSPDTVTAGREIEPGRYDFRGALAGNLRGRAPIYGVVELTCGQPSGQPECWRLVAFERDGESWSPAAAARQEAAGTQAAAAEPLPAPIDVSAGEATPGSVDGERTGNAASDDPAAAEAGTAETEASAESKAIFVVTAPVVNGRVGPGTGYAIAAQVTPEDGLELIERRDDWGRFRIATGAPQQENASPTELWIWLELVEPLQSGGAS